MAVTPTMIEEIAGWCLHGRELTKERQAAWDEFFGTNDPRPIKYWGGAEDYNSRVRRFLGYFLFDWILPDGEKPGVVAARRLYSGRDQQDMINAVNGARFLIAVVRSIDRRTVYLELGDESFEVRATEWAGSVATSQAVVAHLVPVRQRYWLAGPGWMIWPFTFGPGLRSMLKEWEFDPVQVERFIQGRTEESGEERPSPPPQDETLEAAVERMTSWAQAHNRPNLVMSVEKWQELVQEYQDSREALNFESRVLNLCGYLGEDKTQELLDLACNIWNNTPQPSRGGLSPNQLGKLRRDKDRQ